MRATVYGRKLLWSVNPILPSLTLVYYNHEVYELPNSPMTPHQVYYTLQGIIDKTMIPPTIEDYSVKDLEYIASRVPEMAVTIKSYIKKHRLGA